ncbi:hypothetical protein EDB83DRAFT_2555713 [Lactarius deliciosus]|nr:hypothetical protein EDB83DRAFT_2555713 [Lactarius deliciosus]
MCQLGVAWPGTTVVVPDEIYVRSYNVQSEYIVNCARNGNGVLCGTIVTSIFLYMKYDGVVGAKGEGDESSKNKYADVRGTGSAPNEPEDAELASASGKFLDKRRVSPIVFAPYEAVYASPKTEWSWSGDRTISGVPASDANEQRTLAYGALLFPLPSDDSYASLAGREEHVSWFYSCHNAFISARYASVFRSRSALLLHLRSSISVTAFAGTAYQSYCLSWMRNKNAGFKEKLEGVHMDTRRGTM